jgi:hypothetical protein
MIVPYITCLLAVSCLNITSEDNQNLRSLNMQVVWKCLTICNGIIMIALSCFTYEIREEATFLNSSIQSVRKYGPIVVLQSLVHATVRTAAHATTSTRDYPQR